jgi:hypothetical protein
LHKETRDPIVTKSDPYEYLLRNFSKHKFKLYIENSIFNLRSYPQSDLPEFGELHKDQWKDSDFAFMDMPTRMGLMFGVTSYNRWLFYLHHIEDGLIRPEMIWKKTGQEIMKLARRLANDEVYLRGLRETLYDRIGHFVRSDHMFHDPVYGDAQFYYLTNGDMDPFSEEREFAELENSISPQIRTTFLNSARKFGVDLEKADFGIGVGSPKTFLGEMRDKNIRVIKRIEARPDSLYLQFFEGQIEVMPANKRQFYVYDKKKPKPILLDQIIDSSSYFTEEEIEEFESLLNRSNTTESKLQNFLQDHPKFLLHTDYDELRPQISLIDESGCELKPDFFLRPLGKRLWEILDIKLPRTTMVAGSRNRKSLSHYVHRGSAQLMNYAKFFDDPRNRERVFRATGIDCFKPRLTLVIGKKKNVDEETWNQIIEQERPFVDIVGFDELLERAKKTLLRFPAREN